MKSRKKLVFATNNAHKLEEARDIIADSFDILSLSDIGCNDDIPETADTLAGNALIKARWVRDRYGVDCFADDTGLMVDALDGAPGVLSARYAGPGHDSAANMAKLLADLDGEPNRNAHFSTVIALAADGEEHLFEGRVDGSIATEPHGTEGFGYDPVFVANESGRAFAEMTSDEKNAISHRGRAMRRLRDFLVLPLLTILFALGLNSAHAESWRFYPSYDGETYRIIDTKKNTYFLAQMETYPYYWKTAKYSLNLFCYDKEAEEMRHLNSSNILQKDVLANAEYNFENNYLLAAYRDGSIDIIRDNGEILSAPLLRTADVDLSRYITSITFLPGTNEVYIGTEFGYVVVDDRTGEIIRSRNFGFKVDAVTNFRNFIIISTDNKLYYGPLTARSLDDLTEMPGGDKTTRIVHTTATRAYVFTGDYNDKRISYISLKEGVPALGLLSRERELALERTYDGIIFYGGKYIRHFDATKEYKETLLTRPVDDRNTIAGSYNGRDFWFSHGKKGWTQKRAPATDGDPWTLTIDEFFPNASNVYIAGDMLYTDDYGMLVRNHGVTINFASSYMTAPDLLCGLKDMTWTPLSYGYRIPDSGMRFFLPEGIARDPNNPDHFYCGSDISGILRYDIKDPAKSLHMSQSEDVGKKFSGFVPVIDPSPTAFTNQSMFSAPRFDNDGNLWTAHIEPNHPSSETHAELWIWTPADRAASTSPTNFRPWKKLDIDGYRSGRQLSVTPLKHSKNKNLVAYTGGTSGSPLIILNHNGSPTAKADDRLAVMTDPTDQDGNKIEYKEIICMYEDPDTGTLWLGCTGGLYTVKPYETFDNPKSVERIKVSRNDGTNLADFLLEGTRINMITTDATGDKWFATMNGGVVRTSADGHTIKRTYTTSNSELPDNDIHAICYNPKTNSMMISTGLALCELFLDGNGNDVDDDKPRAYPNPVRPGYMGYVTIDNLPEGAMVKIADTAGNTIKELGAAPAGYVEWDLTNHTHKRVPGGVYHIIATNGDGYDKYAKVSKILVVN